MPETFRFAVKAPRRISHIKRLKDCETEAGYLFDAVARLAGRLGAVLVQLPPHARIDVAALASFLRCVPKEAPLAFEFRHASWRDEAVLSVLRAHGAAWVTADDTGEAPEELPATAPWTYLRLRAERYTPAALQAWKRLCDGFERAYVYFKHEDGAAGPVLAARMLKLD